MDGGSHFWEYEEFSSGAGHSFRGVWRHRRERGIKMGEHICLACPFFPCEDEDYMIDYKGNFNCKYCLMLCEEGYYYEDPDILSDPDRWEGI